MLNRNVMFPDGTILDCHEVDNILHIAEAATHIEVVSYKDGEKNAARHTPLVFDLDDTIGFPTIPCLPSTSTQHRRRSMRFYPS